MENPNFIFSSGPIELKEEGEDFFAEGYLSTSELDLVNDIVTKDCIMDMAEQMKSRAIKMDVEHESFKGDTNLEMEINKTIIPIGKIDDFLVDKKGLKIKTILNKHSQRFDEVKGSIQDGFLDAFSIAFMPVESKTEMRGGKEVRLLNKINLLNSAYTGNPVNTGSSMTNVFAKSLEFLEDQKAKPKKPKPQPDPHKEPEEEEDEEEKGCVKKPKKKEKKNHNHSSNDTIKLQEVKNMTEDKDNEVDKPEGEGEDKPEDKKPEEPEKPEGKDNPEEGEDKKPEEPADKPDEPDEPAKEGSDVEGKDIDKLKADMVEVKAALKRPMLKSKVEQVNKAGISEEKSLNPLDVIA